MTTPKAYCVQHDSVSTDAEALAIIEAAGLHPYIVKGDAPEIADHWHDFDSTTFIMQGELTITFAETGKTCVLRKGSRLDL